MSQRVQKQRHQKVGCAPVPHGCSFPPLQEDRTLCVYLFYDCRRSMSTSAQRRTRHSSNHSFSFTENQKQRHRRSGLETPRRSLVYTLFVCLAGPGGGGRLCQMQAHLALTGGAHGGGGDTSTGGLLSPRSPTADRTGDRQPFSLRGGAPDQTPRSGLVLVPFKVKNETKRNTHTHRH